MIGQLCLAQPFRAHIILPVHIFIFSQQRMLHKLLVDHGVGTINVRPGFLDVHHERILAGLLAQSESHHFTAHPQHAALHGKLRKQP